MSNVNKMVKHVLAELVFDHFRDTKHFPLTTASKCVLNHVQTISFNHEDSAYY